MVDDLAPERGPLVGVGHRVVERRLRDPDGHHGDTQAPGVQCTERDLQTLPLVANDAPPG